MIDFSINMPDLSKMRLTCVPVVKANRKIKGSIHSHYKKAIILCAFNFFLIIGECFSQEVKGLMINGSFRDKPVIEIFNEIEESIPVNIT